MRNCFHVAQQDDLHVDCWLLTWLSCSSGWSQTRSCHYFNSWSAGSTSCTKPIIQMRRTGEGREKRTECSPDETRCGHLTVEEETDNLLKEPSCHSSAGLSLSQPRATLRANMLVPDFFFLALSKT